MISVDQLTAIVRKDLEQTGRSVGQFTTPSRAKPYCVVVANDETGCFWAIINGAEEHFCDSTYDDLDAAIHDLLLYVEETLIPSLDARP